MGVYYPQEVSLVKALVGKMYVVCGEHTVIKLTAGLRGSLNVFYEV